MRKLLVFTNISLDGYFEGPEHDLSAFKNDFEAFPTEPGDQAGSLLFGRKTYEMMKFWATPQAAEMAPEVARFMNTTHKYVASHILFDPGWERVTVIGPDVAAAVRQIKEQPGGNIMIFGSNELVVSLLQEGLVDELQIVVNPLAFGMGTPLFRGLQGKTDFNLTGTRPFQSGAVMLTYKPVQ